MQTFGVRVVDRLEEIEVRPLNRPDPLDLAADMHRRRLEADLGAVVLAELGDELAVMGLDALEAFEKIDVKIGAAELAVGDSPQAHVLLGMHDFADAIVLDRVQLLAPPYGRRRSARALPAAAPGEDSCRHGRRETADGTWFLPRNALGALELNALTPPEVLATGDFAAAESEVCHRLAAKNTPQHRRRLALADAAVDLRRMVAGRLLKEARAVVDRAALRVGGGVIEPAQAGKEIAPAHIAQGSSVT